VGISLQGWIRDRKSRYTESRASIRQGALNIVVNRDCPVLEFLLNVVVGIDQFSRRSLNTVSLIVPSVWISPSEVRFSEWG